MQVGGDGLAVGHRAAGRLDDPDRGLVLGAGLRLGGRSRVLLLLGDDEVGLGRVGDWLGREGELGYADETRVH